MKKLPHVLTREGSRRLKERIAAGRGALHRTDLSVDKVLDKVLPASGQNKVDAKNMYKTEADALKLLDQLENDLNQRTSIEVVIAIDPTVTLERDIASWAGKITAKPVILSILADAQIGAGVVAYIDGKIYDKSLDAAIQSYE